MSKALEAIIKTRKWIEQEVENGNKYHIWDTRFCPLCKIFLINSSCRESGECPFYRVEEEPTDWVGCASFIRSQDIAPTEIPLEYALSFMISLEDYYRREED